MCTGSVFINHCPLKHGADQSEDTCPVQMVLVYCCWLGAETARADPGEKQVQLSCKASWELSGTWHFHSQLFLFEGLESTLPC